VEGCSWPARLALRFEDGEASGDDAMVEREDSEELRTLALEEGLERDRAGDEHGITSASSSSTCRFAPSVSYRFTRLQLLDCRDIDGWASKLSSSSPSSNLKARTSCFCCGRKRPAIPAGDGALAVLDAKLAAPALLSGPSRAGACKADGCSAAGAFSAFRMLWRGVRLDW